MKIDKTTGIMYRQWDRQDPDAVLLLVHGLGAHTGRWEFLAEFFLRNGISSYALELRGFGATEDHKGHIDTFSRYYDDIRSLRGIAAGENPGKKIYLVGESLGALISFLTVAAEGNIFDGLICLAPAFKVRPTVPLMQYIQMVLAAAFNPKKQFKIPFNSSMCTRDEEYREVMGNDDREHRVATARFLFNMVTAQLAAGMEKGKIEIPVLFILPGNDQLAVHVASRKVFKGIKAEDKTVMEYPDMFHAVSIDVGKELVFSDMLKWMRDRI